MWQLFVDGAIALFMAQTKVKGAYGPEDTSAEEKERGNIGVKGAYIGFCIVSVIHQIIFVLLQAYTP